MSQKKKKKKKAVLHRFSSRELQYRTRVDKEWTAAQKFRIWSNLRQIALGTWTLVASTKLVATLSVLLQGQRFGNQHPET